MTNSEFQAKVLERFDRIDKRLDGVDKRLDGIDKRLDGIDKRLDGIDKRLDGIDKRLGRVEELLEQNGRFQVKVFEQFRKIDERFDKLENTGSFDSAYQD